MTDCTAPCHPGDDPEPAAPAAYLCRPCTTGLRKDLYHLPRWWADIDELLGLHLAGAGYATTGNVTAAPLPINAKAAEWRSQTLHDLEWWVLEVSCQTGAERPSGARVAALAGWLRGYVLWTGRNSVIYRPCAGDMAGTFAELSRWANAITNPQPPTSACIPAWGNVCPRCHAPGTLRVLRRTAVTCTGCRHEWDSLQLLRLGRDIIRTTTERTAA